MTPLHRLRDLMGFGPSNSTGPLSRITRRDERTVRRWLHGAYPVPSEIAAWCERLGDWLERNPPPPAISGPKRQG
jgi:hypothetical protein